MLNSTRQVNSGVKSARRVLEILELMTSKGEPLALNDIATSLELPRSSTHSLMATLVATGFVRQQADKSYALSTKWLALVSAALGTATTLDLANLRHVAYPIMLRTSGSLDMTCNLAVLNRSKVAYVDKVSSRNTGLQIGTHVGALLPASVTALGKSILSQMDEGELELWMEQHFEPSDRTPNSRRTPEDFLEDLRQARRDGYAIDDEESYLGVICIGSAILDTEGEPVAAISVSGIKPAVEARGIETIGAEVRDAAHAVSAALSGEPVAPERV